MARSREQPARDRLRRRGQYGAISASGNKSGNCGGTKMGLRTPEQYKQALRDGRAVFFRGEKVADVTAHPVIGIAVDHACIDYRMAEDPKYRDLAVINEGGERYSRYFHLPRNGADLLKRSELIAASTREGATLVVLIKEIGSDALLALHIIGERLA